MTGAYHSLSDERHGLLGNVLHVLIKLDNPPNPAFVRSKDVGTKQQKNKKARHDTQANEKRGTHARASVVFKENQSAGVSSAAPTTDHQMAFVDCRV